MKLSHRSPIVRYAEITFVEGRRARSGCDVLIGVIASTMLLLFVGLFVSMAAFAVLAITVLVACGAMLVASELTLYEPTNTLLEFVAWTLGTGLVLALAFLGVRSACRSVEIV